MYKLLLSVKPFHNFAIPTQEVLWTALTMSLFSLLCTAEYTIHNEALILTWYLCVQHIQPKFTITGILHYVSMYLKINKNYPFQQGIKMIIGCSDTQICGVCAVCDMLQCHCASSSAPTAPFFQIASPTD